MLTQRRSGHIDEDHIAGPDHSAVSALLKRDLAVDRDNQLIGLARITTYLRLAAHEPLGRPDPTDETIRRRALPSKPPMVAAFIGSSDPEGTMQTGDFLLPAQRRRRGARTNKAPDVVHDPDSDTTCRSRIALGRWTEATRGGPRHPRARPQDRALARNLARQRALNGVFSGTKLQFLYANEGSPSAPHDSGDALAAAPSGGLAGTQDIIITVIDSG